MSIWDSLEHLRAALAEIKAAKEENPRKELSKEFEIVRERVEQLMTKVAWGKPSEE